LQHRLRKRDKQFLGGVALASAIAIGVGFAVPHGSAEAEPKPGCIKATVAGVMGGGTIHGCGADAKALCRMYAPRYPTVARQCTALPRP
jgi:hypothetical protein